MKRRTYITGGTIALCLLAISVIAQKPQKTEPAKALPKHEFVPVYLGNSVLDGGSISKSTFDSLLLQGIKPKDPASKITGFGFSYNEHTYYEDSVGHIAAGTELLFEYCNGDTLSAALKNNIFTRTKKGDTAYFDKIKVQLPNGNTADGKPMKFVLTK